jgi:glycosyltransferase involved in cell wall biosynthesis
MNVLQIATTNDRSFFNDQVTALEQHGVSCDTIAVSPNKEEYAALVDDLGPIATRLAPTKGHNVPYYAANALWSYPRVLNAVATNEYDIVHTNSGLAAPFGLLQPHRPIVQTLWGTDLMGDYLGGYYCEALKYAVEQFDEVIVRNDAMNRELNRRAHVIPAGVDMEKFREIPRDAARQEVGWDEGRYVLFPYSPDNERKNYPLARTVVKRANEQLSEPVELRTVSRVPHEQIPYYLNASDALLLTSRLEGSPNTVKEALACNVPVVSTDVGDVRERLRDVEPSTVATDPEELVTGLVAAVEQGGRCNGQKQVEPLSWDRVGQQIVELYETVLSGSPRIKSELEPTT